MDVLAQAADAGGSDTAEVVVFWVLSVVAIGTGLAMITMRNIVHAALMLIVNLFAIAGLFLALESEFLAIIQIIVYAGAIMVLFLFVIMLLGMHRDDLLVEGRSLARVGGYLGAAVVAAALVFAFVGAYTGDGAVCGARQPAGPSELDLETVPCIGLTEAVQAADDGSVGLIATTMFTRFTFPFEAASLLLVVATIGAIVLGRRHDVAPADDPAYATDVRVPTRRDVEELLAEQDDGVADDASGGTGDATGEGR